MRRCIFATLIALLVTIIAQLDRMARAQTPGARASDQQIVEQFSTKISAMNPGLSGAIIAWDNKVFTDALPDVRKALSGRKCAGQPCNSKTIDEGVFDMYFWTLNRKGNEPIQMRDIRETLEGSDYVYLWSDPDKADFKLILSGVTVWAAQTNRDRFVPKSNYTLRIEKPGYEPAEVPCSNRDNGGAACGATLKKKN